MTQPPQKEYIITDAQLKKYEGLFFLDDGALEDFKQIRSRPTPSPNPLFDIDAEVAFMKQHDTAIRNATLDAITEFVLNDCNVRMDERNGKKFLVLSGDFPVSKLLEKIQSLRTQEQP